MLQTASLNVVDILKIKPQQKKKAIDEADPLAFARNKGKLLIYTV